MLEKLAVLEVYEDQPRLTAFFPHADAGELAGFRPSTSWKLPMKSSSLPRCPEWRRRR